MIDALVEIDPTKDPALWLGPNATKVLRRPDGALRVMRRGGEAWAEVGASGTCTGITTSTGNPFYLAMNGLVLAAAKRQGVPVRRDWTAWLYGPDHEPLIRKLRRGRKPR